MKIEHIAVTSNSIEDSDKFFIDLLGLKKKKDFLLPKDLTQIFFGLDKEQRIVRYGNDNIDFEIFITNQQNVQSIFAHSCIIVENRDELLKKAISMGFATTKAIRKDRDYILFIKDLYGNSYEIK